jgi:hypothetical protein
LPFRPTPIQWLPSPRWHDMSSFDGTLATYRADIERQFLVPENATTRKLTEKRSIADSIQLIESAPGSANIESVMARGCFSE